MIVYFIRRDEHRYGDEQPRYNIFTADKLPYTKVGPNTFVVEPVPELTFVAFTETEELARKIVAMLVKENLVES